MEELPVGDLPSRSSRRGFLDWFLTTSVGALVASVLYPVVSFLDPPHERESTASEVDAGPENDPELLDRGFKIVRFGAEPVILLRVGPEDYRAFAATCTHLQCIVEYRKGPQVLWCNCHNGVFDLTGRNIEGPPPKPLATYSVHRVSRSGAPASLVVSKA